MQVAVNVMLGALLTLTTVLAEDAHGYCREGWVLSGRVCIKVLTEMTSWVDGWKACQALGADLATPDTKAKVAALMNIVDEKRNETHSYIYTNIGLYKTKADDWTWVNGHSMTWTNWQGGGPSNSGKIEECVEMLTYHEGKFNDVSCEYSPGRAVTACQMPMDVDGAPGAWGAWSAWTRSRDRKCDNPVPQNGGTDCKIYKMKTYEEVSYKTCQCTEKDDEARRRETDGGS